ncbi:OLC1v1016889C1 [Oldenlandia corymbosa var. corymbosa]|uniref:OLC1v1016889C1 n=1 Tax=Oldenlandia corymbosa var. corymbosa TaxID=529605 RepID=A0AAV1E876_OLDCO|nr:OLC1v1016889C1 [Oldenlandia corymbosa var. corymbosa]
MGSKTKRKQNPFFCNLLLQLLLLQTCSNFAKAGSIVQFLPGFEGHLPFELETGYIGVDESEDVQLFYYFIKSESNPETDPLLLWLTGGPGCSSFSGLAYEIGPIVFEQFLYDGTLPKLILNPYSWTKVASIIFVDQPSGTGFSYARTAKASHSSDLQVSDQLYEFLGKWFIDHREFISNPVYVGGDSYAGVIVPVVSQLILNGNEVGIERKIDFKLISMTRKAHILEPYCGLDFPEDPNGKYGERRSLTELFSTQKMEGRIPITCRTDEMWLSYYWSNDESVREALQIRKGTIGEWIRCNSNISYTENLVNAVPYHANISRKGYPSLIYSGDHDLLIPHFATEAWIKSLNYQIVNDWRQWIVGGQVAGYTRTYANKMTFATVKGGGHTAPQYKPEQCQAMFKRWISNQPL